MRHSTNIRRGVTALSAVVMAVAVAAGTARMAPADAAPSTGVTAVRLTTEHATDPLGIDTARPRLSWQLDSAATNELQTAYQVVVAPDAQHAGAGHGSLWDSGRVASGQSVDVPYGGPALRSGTRYYWSVRVWDSHGQVSAWSQPAWWEMGLLTSGDWGGAQWIGQASPDSAPVSEMQWNYPAQLQSGHTLGQTFTTTGLFDGACGVFPTWVTTGSGMTLTLYSGGPGGSVVANRTFSDVPDNSTQCLTFTAQPAGVYYLQISDPVGTIGWWSDSNDVLTAGQAYADGSPVAGDRALQIHVPSYPEPQLRTDFTAAKNVAQARLYVSAGGYYVAYLNGQRVGGRQLDPGFTVYNQRMLYSTYDVTHQVQHGANAIGLALGRGFFGINSPNLYWGSAPWLGEPRVLVKLDLTYTDGTHQVTVSGPDWRTHPGPTLTDSVYNGETYDARQAQTGWDSPGFADAGWSAAAVLKAPAATLSAEQMQPIQVTGTLRATRITQPKPGTYVFKFPANIAGWPQLRVSGPAGTAVTLRMGEVLNSDGTVDNQGDPGLTPGEIQRDTYVLNGSGAQIWQPQFSYAGFQYVQVDGYPGTPGPGDVVAQDVHSAVPSTGQFTSSDGLINAIHAATRSTILNNLHSIPTDTPMYEKRGWLGDTQLDSAPAVDNFGMQRFYANWLRSIGDDQGSDGNVPDLVPNNAPGGGLDPAWGSAYLIIPWRLYQDYGDTGVLADNYSGMRAYVNYLAAKATNDIEPGFYGDWVPPEPPDGSYSYPPEGPNLVATAYFYHDSVLLSQIAQKLGNNGDAAHYADLAASIKTAFNATYLDTATGVYQTSTNAGYRQTSSALPLLFGLVPADQAGRVAANLAADVRAHGDHLNTGIMGTMALLPVLTQYGQADLAYAIATQTTYPSWGYWLSLGATTLWEDWTSHPRSHDHAMFGTVDDWFYQYLAGIQPADGFHQITIRPYVPTGLTHVAASEQTPYGRTASEWTAAGGKLTLTVTIPPNTQATIGMPTASGSTVHAPPGANPAGTTSGAPAFTVGGGTYTFTSQP